MENPEEPAVTPEPAEPIVRPIPRFSLRVEAETLRALVNAIVPFVSEEEADAVFNITGEGLIFKQMDTSHIALISINRPSSRFTSYEVTEEGKLCVSIAMLNKVLGRSKSKDIEYISLSTTDEGKLRVSFDYKEGNTLKVFHLPLMEEAYIEPPEPKLEHTTRVKLEASELYRALQDTEIVSDVVRVTTNGDSIRLNAQGETLKAEVTFDKSDTLDLYTQEETSAIYAIEYLLSIVKVGNDLCDIVTLEYSKDLPCKVSFEDEAHFWLAPRIEG